MTALRWEISIGSRNARFGDQDHAFDVELTDETVRRLIWHLEEWLEVGVK